jgi:ubiquinone biosynthesis protein
MLTRNARDQEAEGKMNAFQFIGLMRMIYGSGPIDLQRIQSWGLLAVKIGQVHALRLDFLPVEKCQELAQLYRKNDHIPAEALLARIDRSIFDRIDPQPLASASVGQVHRAIYQGQDVVVKIIKQDFKRNFIRDVQSVRRLTQIILAFYPKLSRVFDPLGILQHIEDYTLREIDLTKERQGQAILKDIYEKNKERFDLSQLCFPHIYSEISSAEVMVSDFVPGLTFDELLDQGRMPYDQLLELFRLHGFYLFRIGVFHGDIHPGNLILNQGKIFFIDTGAISTASPRLSQGLLNFFDALSVDDYDQCASRLNQMAETGIEGPAYEKFRRDFHLLYADFKNSTVAQVSLTKKMMQTIKLGVNSGMRFEQGMFPIIKSLMYLDGMVLRCNPQAVLLRDMRQFIDQLRI